MEEGSCHGADTLEEEENRSHLDEEEESLRHKRHSQVSVPNDENSKMTKHAFCNTSMKRYSLHWVVVSCNTPLVFPAGP